MTFGASINDVIVFLKKTSDRQPNITSVVITDGALPGENVKEEYCPCECGRQNEIVPAIIDADEAREGHWPWSVGSFFSN